MTIPSAFALPPRLAAKAHPDLLSSDDTHFAAITAALTSTVDDLTRRLDAVRTTPARAGQEILERDLETHRLSSRLSLLRRFSLDLCLGRMTSADGTTAYVGRAGLKDRTGRILLVDWRSAAAEPFFAATVAHPMGLTSRRRYRWSGGRVVDFWDESLMVDDAGPALAPDDESAVLASLGQARTPAMQDVLATIAADQDAIIRSEARGALLVDGGPGTGKTVVALHRAAYLLYTDPRLARHRGSVLFLGPTHSYLRYIADVLPRLGEDGVQSCTLADLLPEGVAAGVEGDPEVAQLKSSIRMVQAIEPAVAFYEEPPTDGMEVATAWGPVPVTRRDWADAFAAVEPGTPHNEARDQIWEELAEIVAAKLPVAEDDTDVSVERVEAGLRRIEEVADAVNRSWPLLDPRDVIDDLWQVPAYLRRCAPWLSREQAARLRRADPRAWTDADLPLLDAARHRLGDPSIEARRRRARAERAAADREMDAVVEHLVSADDSELRVMSMLSGQDLRTALADEPYGGPPEDPLAGPFAHVIVDEAQELTDAQWAMVLRRCPSRSVTIVGDRAQARRGFPESWTDRLARVGLTHVTTTALTINYRTPAEVMTVAAPIVRAVLPDANIPTSIRRSGVPVVHAARAQLERLVADWLQAHDDGTVAVIARSEQAVTDVAVDPRRVQILTPQTAKGLEFDLVVLVDPDGFGPTVEGAVDRYVAMTRTTRELVLLTGSSSSS